jgi:hypothetical protein
MSKFKDNMTVDVPHGMTNGVDLWKLIQIKVLTAKVYDGKLS